MNSSNPRGVDLSHFNVSAEFHEMVDAGISFVYLKATQGENFVDPTYADRRVRALSVGLRVGSYHFYDPQSPASEQADQFLHTIGKLLPGELPPALDLEATPGWDSISQSERVHQVDSWLNEVEGGLGVRPMIYTSMGWWKGEFGNADFSGHPLWLAHYDSAPGDTGLWKYWTAWQYGQFGSVSGAGTGDVDTDVWYSASL